MVGNFYKNFIKSFVEKCIKQPVLIAKLYNHSYILSNDSEKNLIFDHNSIFSMLCKSG